MKRELAVSRRLGQRSRRAVAITEACRFQRLTCLNQTVRNKCDKDGSDQRETKSEANLSPARWRSANSTLNVFDSHSGSASTDHLHVTLATGSPRAESVRALGGTQPWAARRRSRPSARRRGSGPTATGSGSPRGCRAQVPAGSRRFHRFRRSPSRCRRSALPQQQCL